MAYKSVDSNNQFEVLEKNYVTYAIITKCFFYMSAWSIEKKSHFIDMSADEIYPDKTKIRKINGPSVLGQSCLYSYHLTPILVSPELFI